jgi:hypothetical protein
VIDLKDKSQFQRELCSITWQDETIDGDTTVTLESFDNVPGSHSFNGHIGKGDLHVDIGGDI